MSNVENVFNNVPTQSEHSRRINMIVAAAAVTTIFTTAQYFY